ncbi:MAG: tetratricopeptide repeat protein [Mycobacterium sp.]
MAGAIDLSALKQRAQQPPGGGAGGGAAPGDGTAVTAIQVTEANFEAEVLVRSNTVPVVVVLWTPRSDASIQLVELFAGLAGSDAGKWALATVNVDTTPRVAQAFGVQAVPTVVALAGAQPVASFQGVLPPEELRTWVDQLLNGGPAEGEAEEVAPELAAARGHLDDGDFEAAKAAYQAILDSDPAHVEAKGAVRQIEFLARATGHPQDAVAISDAAPGDIDAAFAAADVLVLGQDVTAAFSRLIALVRTTFGDDRTRVRTRLIELFDLFDPADPDVITGRRNLANALY